MTELTAVLLAFPTVIFTVLLGVTLVYWLFVVIGAIDLDALGGGHADGAFDGHADGAFEGAVKGAAEGAAKGIAEGVAEVAPDGFAGFLSALRLRSAPVTVVVSLFATFGWFFSVLVMQALGTTMGGLLPAWLLGVVVFGAASIVSLLTTSVVIRPLGRLFITRVAKGRGDLVGRVCVVSTGRVDAAFGQATLEDGGAGLILPVRCETAGALRRGDRALVIGWDADRDGFIVEPIDMMDRPMPAAVPGQSRAEKASPKQRAPEPSPSAARVAAEAELEAEAEPPPSERARRA